MFVGVWRTVNEGSQTKAVASSILRVYMNTNIACLITACVAGKGRSKIIFIYLCDSPYCKRGEGVQK